MHSWLPPLLAAPFVGSFLGVVILRLPAGEAFGLSRSHCDACGRVLSPLELVPLVSYLALRGRCRGCDARIAPFHLAIELAALLVAAMAAAAAGDDPALAWSGCVLGWLLLALAWIDAVHMRLPNVLTLPLVLLGLGATAVLDPAALTDHALGALCGFVAFRAISLGYRALRGREGLGRGDAWLLAACGAWLGWQQLPLLVLGAALLGLLWVAIGALRRRATSRTTQIPFGPCLSAALWALWIGNALLADPTATWFAQ